MGGKALDWGLGNNGGKEDDEGDQVALLEGAITVGKVEGQIDGPLNEDGINDLNLREKPDMEVLSSNS